VDKTAACALDKSLRLGMVTWWLQTWHRQHGRTSHGRHTDSRVYCIEPAVLVGNSKHTATSQPQHSWYPDS